MTSEPAPRPAAAEQLVAYAAAHGVSARAYPDGVVRVWVEWTSRRADGTIESGTETHDVVTWAVLRRLLGY